MSENDKELKGKEKILSKSKVFFIIFGLLAVVVLIFLLWFFNRKFEVSFDLGNGTKGVTISVKYNKTIDKSAIKDKNDLGDDFIGWYEVIGAKNGKDVLAKDVFDFKKSIDKNIKLKAVYSKKPETITITFDSNGGSKVNSITINKGVELTLPEEPTKDGYKFVTWEDKNGVPVYNKVLLDESITLYAKWDEVEEKVEKGKKTEQSENNENKKDSPKEEVYYCDKGYTLEGKKCTKTETKNANGRCPQGYNGGAWDREYCLTEIDVDYEWGCANHDSYKASEAVYDENNGMCYYRKVYDESNPRYCSSHGRVYYNGACYSASFPHEEIEFCPSGGTKNSSGMCELRINKLFYCEDGYELNGKKCSRTLTVDAKKK